MRKKIVALVVLMLVATTVVSATNINVKEKIRPKSTSVDVPVWKKGDSWTYNYHRAEYRYNGSTLWYRLYYNASFTQTVTDDTGGNYTLKITSKNSEGRAYIGSYRLKFTALTKWNEELNLRKTDLALIRDVSQIKGLVFWLIGGILPFPAQYQQGGTASFITPEVFLPFPLTVGDGALPGCSYTLEEKCTLYWGLITLFNNPTQTITQSVLPYHCEMTNITVPAGTYNAYNVSVDFPVGMHGHYSWVQYFVPETGYNAKWYVHYTLGGGQPVQDLLVELVSNTYTQ